jgi:hypothetical protein
MAGSARRPARWSGRRRRGRRRARGGATGRVDGVSGLGDASEATGGGSSAAAKARRAAGEHRAPSTDGAKATDARVRPAESRRVSHPSAPRLPDPATVEGIGGPGQESARGQPRPAHPAGSARRRTSCNGPARGGAIDRKAGVAADAEFSCPCLDRYDAASYTHDK